MLLINMSLRNALRFLCFASEKGRWLYYLPMPFNRFYHRRLIGVKGKIWEPYFSVISLNICSLVDQNFRSNALIFATLRCKVTTKNPNVQIKFILFCHLQDFANVTSGELRSKAASEGTMFF